MRIGVDLRSLLSPHRTGVGEYTVELLSAIFKLDQTNDYYLFYNSFSDSDQYIPTWPQQNVHVLATHFPNKLFNASQKLINFPKLDKILIDHFRLPSLDYFFSPHFNFTALSPSTKHLLTIHDLAFDFFPHFQTPRQRLGHQFRGARAQCEKAHLIFAPSENTKRDLAHHYDLPAEKIKVLYPGLSPVFSQPPASDVKKKYRLPARFILFLGTIEPRKNISALIEAYEMTADSLEVHLVIAGAPGWKNAAVRERAAQSKFADKIHFIGYVDEADKPALYQAAEVFVYPSFYEGFGFPVLEALASGVPCVVSNRSSLPEITGTAAYLVNPYRPGEIALGLKRILFSKALKDDFVRKGLEQSKKFRWENAAREWLKSIQN